MTAIMHGVLEPHGVYLFACLGGEWAVRKVRVNVRDLDFYGYAPIRLAGGAGLIPAPYGVPQPEFGHGSPLVTSARTRIEAVYHARRLQADFDRAAPRPAYGESVRALAAGLYASMLWTTWRFGVREPDFEAVGNLAALALDLAVRVAARPEVEPGSDGYAD